MDKVGESACSGMCDSPLSNLSLGESAKQCKETLYLHAVCKQRVFFIDRKTFLHNVYIILISGCNFNRSVTKISDKIRMAD